MARETILSPSPSQASENGNAFMSGGNQGAAASNYSHIQFLNPVGSGVIATIDRVQMRAGAATILTMRRYDTALTSNVTGKTNKYIGKAAPACQVRTQNNATALGTTISQARTGNSEYLLEMIGDGPIIVPEGLGIAFTTSSQNVQLTGFFEWREGSS